MSALTQDYFALFGIAPAPRLDLSQLKHTYLILQKQFHPDKFVSKSQQEQLLAVQMTANINQAYRVLTDVILRADYLLGLQTEPDDAEQTISDSEFLMAQMQLHESLEAVENQTQKTEFIDKITESLDDLLTQFSENYQTNHPLAKLIVQKMQFFNRLSNTINAKEF